MTTGSTANLAFAFETLCASRPPQRPNLEPLHRLVLILVSDQFGGGAAMLDADELHRLCGSDDPTEIEDALKHLAARGLIRLSRIVEGRAFAGSTIATEAEIADARNALGCQWPFENWTGAP